MPIKCVFNNPICKILSGQSNVLYWVVLNVTFYVPDDDE